MQRLFRTNLLSVYIDHLSVYRDRDVRKHNIRNRSCPVVIRTFSRSWQRCGERKVYSAILTRPEFSCSRNSFRFYLSRSNIATRIRAGRCDGCSSAQRNNNKLVIAESGNGTCSCQGKTVVSHCWSCYKVRILRNDRTYTHDCCEKTA